MRVFLAYTVTSVRKETSIFLFLFLALKLLGDYCSGILFEVPWTALTGLKRDLTKEDPARGEVELELDEPAESLVQLDGDVASVLHDQVRHVGEVHGLAGEVPSAHTEVDLGVGEHLAQTVTLVTRVV